MPTCEVWAAPARAIPSHEKAVAAMPALFAHLALAALAAGLVALVPHTGAVAQTGASPWAEDHASRARLVAGEATPEARWAGLEIALDEGFKTYWRTPGESGIPAELDWTGSRNVASVEVDWPAPARFDDPYGAYYGYLEHVVLPLRVTPVDPAEPVTLSLSMFYGVCKDICIPATGEMALELPPEPVASAVVVARARERVPTRTPLGDTEGPLAVLAVTPVEGDTLAVRVRAPEGAILLAEGPDDAWFLAPGATMDQNGVFTVEVAQKPRGATGRVPLRLTLVAGDAAIEVEAETDLE